MLNILRIFLMFKVQNHKYLTASTREIVRYKVTKYKSTRS